MNPLVIGLVVASAIVHATWNLWLEQLGPGPRAAPLMWLLTALSATVYAPLALTVAEVQGFQLTPPVLLLVVGSGLIHVVYFLALLRGYRHGDLSLVYPLARGTGPLVAAVGAMALFHERPTPLSIAGMMLVALGVLVLTLRPAHAGHTAAGIGYGLATGALIAVYTLWDGWAVKRAGLTPLIFYWCGEVVRVVLFTPSALRDRRGVTAIWREQRLRVFGIAMLSPLSYMLILLAFQRGAVSHLAPAREMSILIGAWLGGQVLGEGGRRRRLIAAASFAAGVIALTLA